MVNCFHAADILVPQKISLRKWACVACDQYSSQPEYWERVRDFVGEEPSTYHMIFPEAFLETMPRQQRIESIHSHMEEYLSSGIFRNFRSSFLYVERTMGNGQIRHGLIGQLDLEEYDFTPGSSAHIRATEGTVQERIPPRVEILRDAALEFPHVLLLCDDRRDEIMSAARETDGEIVYDFDLMEHGGHIKGKIISGLGVSLVNTAISRYIQATEASQPVGNAMSFVVGDGNHSLASLKACWDQLKPTLTEEERMYHPGRYALVELENIHDEAIRFEPIHRLLKNVDVEEFLSALKPMLRDEGHPIGIVTRAGKKTVYLDREESPLAVAVLQPFLDTYLKAHPCTIDYIHGEEALAALAREEHSVGILLEGMDKKALFPGVLKSGVLPRKTFSMGEAHEKRFYLEGKRRR